MSPKRIHVKLFLEDPRAIPADTAFRIFNHWIAETHDEVLVDVADYSHIHAGPVTLLVGHEADYSIDNAGGEMGLLYARKQPLEGELAQQLEQALAAALRACRRLEEDPGLEGRARFRGDRLVFTLNDRLNAPNTAQTRAALRPAFEMVLSELYGDAALSIEAEEDPGRLLSLRVEAEAQLGVSQLLERLC